MELIIRAVRFLTRGGADSRQMIVRLTGMIALVVLVWLAVRLTQNAGAPPPLQQHTLPEQGAITLMGAIEMDGSVSGTLEQGERHGWSFTGERGQLVDLRVFGDWDSTLELIAPGSDAAIAIDFNSGGGSTALLCGQRLLADGAYIAVVSGYLGVPNRDFGDYRLELSARPASDPVPIAYGDTISERAETCDGDFYLLDVEQGETLEIAITPEDGADLFARLLTADSARRLLLTSRETTNEAGQPIDLLRADILENARLLINVSRRIDHPPADYVMTVTHPQHDG